MRGIRSSTKHRLAGTIRVVLAGLFVGATATMVSPSPPASSQATDELAVVGTLGRMPADALAVFGESIKPDRWDDPAVYATWTTETGTLLPVPHLRQLWQFFPTGFAGGGGTTAVAVRDYDSLKITRTFVLDGHPLRGTTAASGGEWMHALDGGRRLFLVMGDGTIIEFDLKTFEQKRDAFFQAPFGVRLGGVSFDPHSNSLIALAGGVSGLNVANTTTVIFKRDLATGDVSAQRPVRSCTGPLPPTDQSATYAIPVMTSADFLYFACHRAGQVGAVVRLPRATAYVPGSTEDVTVGPVYLETALADHGSGRMFLATNRGEVWAFDTQTMSFVGVVATHGKDTSEYFGFGIDGDTGRLFSLSSTYGLGIAEGRFFPIPQARTFPALATKGQERILSDARTGRILVIGGAHDEKQRAYTIYQVGEAPVPPPPPDPDRSTVDRAEQDGVTEARYFANGSGYGVRSVLANGISTIAPAPTVGVLAPTAQIIADHLNSRCGFTDRELVAGRVAKAEYDTGSASAQAIAVDVDERTKLDLERPSRCDISAPSAAAYFKGVFSIGPMAEHDSGPGWTRKPDACTSSAGGESKQFPGDNQGMGTSSVECPAPGGVLKAYGEAHLDGGIKVGKAYTKTVIEKTDKGVLSTVTAVAEDVSIANTIQFEEIRSDAVSLANGRPSRGSMSTHTTRVKGVKLAGTQLCSAACDVDQVVATLNQALAGRIQFRTRSGVDEGRLMGSDKGALTAVQKSPERQASDQALIGDFTTEVPALEMIVYNDNTEWGRARQLYQFAGVSSVAGYSVVLLPTGIGFGDDGGDPGLMDAMSDGGLDGAASFGTPGSGMSEVAAPASSTDGPGGLAGVLRALGRGIRLFFTSPRHALLLLTAWGLLSLPALLSRRRRLLAAARSS